MAFQLRPGESARQAVRRITRKEISKARAALAGETGLAPEEVIHDGRKRFKRIRAVLRLVRSELGEKDYSRWNIGFRDAARPLSEIRDAQALLQAVDKLAERQESNVPAETWAVLREALRDRERRISADVLAQGDVLDGILATLDDAARAVKHWPIGKRFSALARGLKTTYQLGRRAFVQASEEPTTENLHEWRKRVKDFWHHLEILQPTRPGVLAQLADRAHHLADLLGDDHDLAVLSTLLEDGTLGVGEEVRGRLLALIETRRDESRRATRELGQEVYREKPRDLVGRLGVYWRLWRWENEAARWEQMVTTGTDG